MKTRILAIVPYPGMQQILNDIATQYEDIELTVRISSLEKAVEKLGPMLRMNWM